jgi:S1-C subfamily serine protease
MPSRVGGAGADLTRQVRFGLIAVTAIGLLPNASAAQMRMSMGSGVALALPGGSVAVLGGDSTGVVVRGVVAGEGGAQGKALLTEGDRVVTLQGGPVASLDRFASAWGAIPEGAEVVLGLVGGGGETTVRFPRQPHQSDGRQMVVQGPGGGAGAWTAMGPPGGGPTEMLIAGARIRNNGQGMPEVVLRGSDPAAAQVPLRVGDIVVSVNGERISALAGLELFYGPVAVGQMVVFEVERKGVRHELRFPKPAGG